MRVIKIKIPVFFLVVCVLVSCDNPEPKAEGKAEVQTEAKTVQKQPPAFANLMANWKVKEGYEIKVFRNDQVEYPIFIKGLQAAIWFEENKPENAKISALIDAATIETGNPDMDKHAKEADVLNAEKFPFITFESTSVSKTSSGYEAAGKLNLKGVTKEIKFPFVFQNETFAGKFAIAASDFGITTDPNVVPNGQIKIELIIPVEK